MLSRSRNSNWTKNSFFKNQKLKRTSNRKWKLYNIQLNVAIQTECIITLLRIVQHKKQIRSWKNKKFSNKIAKTNYFNAIKNLQHTTIDFNYSISLLFSTTNVNYFKFSIIHNNNNKSKTSKQLKKSAHFVETFIQNKFHIFKTSKNHWKTTRKQRFRSFCFQCRNQKSKSKISKIDQTLISIKIYRNIFVKKFHDDDFDNNTRSKNYTNVIQFQITTKIKNSRKINKKLIKIHCIVDVLIAWIVNATNKIVFEFHEIHIVSNKKNVNFAKIDNEKTTNVLSDHFRTNSHRIMKISINNQQQTITTTNFLRRIILTLSSNIVAWNFAWLIAINFMICIKSQ